MLNFAVQVSVSPEYFQTPKEKKDRHWENYLAPYYQKNTRKKDRHKLSRKTRY
jgi:hypothetical protein